ncbi:L-threonylcarbamoyladenylate synthase [Lachnospiraceae bacterium XBB2008]|nr:L-threonylcarbamoyladenylate synthase [Lachnospiraceae bacterium XBB2008]
MDTVIARIDPSNPDPGMISRAGGIIRSGGLVAFPTETVYGLGGDALSGDSSRAIYAAKGRPSDNPLIVHIADMKSLGRIVKSVPDKAYALAEKFWPGPLTMIMDKSDEVPYATTGGLDTVAVRFPSDPVAQAFIRAAGGYVAAPSANLSGKPSPTSGKYVVEDMDGRIDMILYGDDSVIGLESTIVDLTGTSPVILRPGYITLEMLRSVLPDVSVDTALLADDDKTPPKAPGMKYRHYAPKGDLVIVEGERPEVIQYITDKLVADASLGKRTGVIASTQTASSYKADVVLDMGDASDHDEIARRLFGLLREMDDEEVDSIYSEAVSGEGVAAAIMNRLLKAAGHNIVVLGDIQT